MFRETEHCPVPICGACEREVSEHEVAYYRVERIYGSERSAVQEIKRIPVCRDCAEQKKAATAD